MTPDRAVKLGQQVARAALAGGPHDAGILEARITNQVADLLLNVDWRMMPEDEKQEKADQKLFEGQMGLPL